MTLIQISLTLNYGFGVGLASLNYVICAPI